jgi:hypothetical protein
MKLYFGAFLYNAPIKCIIKDGGWTHFYAPNPANALLGA